MLTVGSAVEERQGSEQYKREFDLLALFSPVIGLSDNAKRVGTNFTAFRLCLGLVIHAQETPSRYQHVT